MKYLLFLLLSLPLSGEVFGEEFPEESTLFIGASDEGGWVDIVEPEDVTYSFLKENYPAFSIEETETEYLITLHPKMESK